LQTIADQFSHPITEFALMEADGLLLHQPFFSAVERP
jgi:hypothetical protein